MTQVKTLFSALGRMTKQRQALKAREGSLADRERKLFADIGRALSDRGYRLERVGEIQATSPTRRTRSRRKRQDLKCPKCDRRFFFAMHVARHLNAMHGRRQGDTRKVKAA
jgi:uncharacterized C2H2 Zn-finger protein